MNPSHSKHVPGSKNCQDAYLEIEYFQQDLAPTPSISLDNCILYPGGGFNCKNWRSVTLLKDLDYATTFQQQQTDIEPFDSSVLRSKSSITIWKNTIYGSDEVNVLTFWTLLPCVSKFSVKLDDLLAIRQCNECIILEYVKLLRTCGNLIPLSYNRIKLLEGAMFYFEGKMTYTLIALSKPL